jgi:hypothetical protein
MVPSVQRVKHPAKLPATLQRSLSLYAVAASAAGVQLLALTQPSEAEVVYTPAHTFIGRNQSFSFDLNHDGVNDFTITNNYKRSGSTYTGCHLDVTANAGGEIRWEPNTENENLAAVFQKGQTIGFTEQLGRQTAIMEAIYFLCGTAYYTSGFWRKLNNHYLGLAFKIDGQIHFGWARLDVQTTGLRIQTLLTGYAYETQPNTPIIAGDTGGSLEADREPQSELKTEPQATETSRLQQPRPAASLGALSLGAPGLPMWRLAIWRRPDF